LAPAASGVWPPATHPPHTHNFQTPKYRPDADNGADANNQRALDDAAGGEGQAQRRRERERERRRQRREAALAEFGRQEDERVLRTYGIDQRDEAEEEGEGEEQDQQQPQPPQQQPPPTTPATRAARGSAAATTPPAASNPSLLTAQETAAVRAAVREAMAAGAAGGALTAAALVAGGGEGSAGNGNGNAAAASATSPTATTKSWKADYQRRDVVHGRFTPREDATIRAAVEAYADAAGIDASGGYGWVFTLGRGKGARGVDAGAAAGGGASPQAVVPRSQGGGGLAHAVAASLPHRHVKAVWARMQRLYSADAGLKRGRFSAEESALLARLVAEKGVGSWTAIAKAMGRTPESVRDRWREVGVPAALAGVTAAAVGGSGSGDEGEGEGAAAATVVAAAAAHCHTGRFSDAELDRLRQLVEDYRAARRELEGGGAGGGGGAGARGGGASPSPDGAAAAAHAAAAHAAAARDPAFSYFGAVAGSAPRPSARNLVDDIAWDVVAEGLPGRSSAQCRREWYRRLAPTMAERGEWGSDGADDRALLRFLLRAARRREREARRAGGAGAGSAGVLREGEVSWADAVPGRSAAAALRRWQLMRKALPADAAAVVAAAAGGGGAAAVVAGGLPVPPEHLPIGDAVRALAREYYPSLLLREGQADEEAEAERGGGGGGAGRQRRGRRVSGTGDAE
jgi:hypothetical protein